MTNQYAWGLDLSGALQGAGGIGGLLAEITRDGVRYPFCDGNGNITDWIDSEGELISHHEYDPYGNEMTGNPPASFGFSSKPYDHVLGLYYYGYRFYSPEMGRWMNRDPIEEIHFTYGIKALFISGNNLYGCTANNLINTVDYLGLAYGNPVPTIVTTIPPTPPTPTHRKNCKPPLVWKQKKNGEIPPEDGCSVPWPWTYLLRGNKDNPTGKCSFKDACDAHDRGYSNCAQSKSETDSDFFDAMQAACMGCNLDYEDLYECVMAAITYARAVELRGSDAYEGRQSKNCECGCP